MKGRARQSIDFLKQQLETERQNSQQLGQSIEAMCQTEADLHSKVGDLEGQLEASKTVACQYESDRVQLEQKVRDLQQQLEQKVHELQQQLEQKVRELQQQLEQKARDLQQLDQNSKAANEKLEDSKRRCKHLEDELSKHKV